MAAGQIKNLAPRALLGTSVLIALLGAASPAWSNHGRMRNEVNLFQNFLQSQPKVAAELRTNPNLVNNKKYLDKHDELAKFLKRHPDVKRELVNHPSRIFGNYYREGQARWNHRG